ncbi:MAG: hypothetical protein IT384_25045 [Deltaproteobacteria bacterium]|nr:hypothetical protein [Deltaproteobacteria bacterium]
MTVAPAIPIGALAWLAACAAGTPAPAAPRAKLAAPTAAATAPTIDAERLSEPRAAPPPVVERAMGPSFSVPIPKGFEQYSAPEQQPIYEAGGLVLAQRERPKLADAFQASIVVAPLPNKGLDLKDAILCLSIANNAARSLNGTVVGAKKATRASGTSCQVLVKPNTEAHKLSRAEVIGGPKQAWMVTCNYDPRDKGALSSCDEVLDGFEPVRASGAVVLR